MKGSLPGETGAPWTASVLPSALDLCHVADCARAVAAIHSAGTVEHRVYNVGGGHSASVDELLDAVAAVVPDAVLPDELRSLSASAAPEAHMDITRVRTEFGYEPHYSIETGITDYANWLKDHDR